MRFSAGGVANFSIRGGKRLMREEGIFGSFRVVCQKWVCP